MLDTEYIVIEELPIGCVRSCLIFSSVQFTFYILRLLMICMACRVVVVPFRLVSKGGEIPDQLITLPLKFLASVVDCYHGFSCNAAAESISLFLFGGGCGIPFVQVSVKRQAILVLEKVYKLFRAFKSFLSPQVSRVWMAA